MWFWTDQGIACSIKVIIIRIRRRGTKIMGSIFIQFPKGKRKALTLSYDDGVEQDIRLIEIMKQHGLKGTFNLNSGLYAEEGTVYPPGTVHRRMTEKAVTEVYGGSGMEVAVHGLTHPFLEQLPVNLCTAEVMKDRENLERQFHTIVRGMAYPFGTTSGRVVDTLVQAGIAYARTTVSTWDFRLPSDWLRLTATCHHRDERLMELAEKFVEETPKYGSWLFYLWGHSYEFEADGNWDVIERFAAYTGNRNEIWYATNLELYDYMTAYDRLQFSADGSMVWNPAAVDVYFEKDGISYRVKAGERMELN